MMKYQPEFKLTFKLQASKTFEWRSSIMMDGWGPMIQQNDIVYARTEIHIYSTYRAFFSACFSGASYRF